MIALPSGTVILLFNKHREIHHAPAPLWRPLERDGPKANHHLVRDAFGKGRAGRRMLGATTCQCN